METITYQPQPEKLHSDEINEIAKALSKMQGCKVISKESGLGNFKKTYATITDIWECIAEPLAVNGLAATQIIRGLELHTLVMHTSGQWLKSMALLQPSSSARSFAWEMGSQITYMKRYSLCAILGIASDEMEDDGAAASPNEPAVIEEKAAMDTLKEALRAKGFADGFLRTHLQNMVAKSKKKLSITEMANSAVDNLDLFVKGYAEELKNHSS